MGQSNRKKSNLITYVWRSYRYGTLKVTKACFLYITFRQRNDYLWRLDKTKGFVFKVANNGKVTKFTYVAFLVLNSLTLVIGCFLSSWYREGDFTWEIYFLLSGGKIVGIRVSFCFCSGCLSIILIQNDLYTRCCSLYQFCEGTWTSSEF